MKSRYRKRCVAALVACGLALTPAAALAQLSVGSDLGTTMRDVLIGLEEQGYTVIELELKRNEIEAEVILDNRRYEIEVDTSTGKVTEIELED